MKNKNISSKMKGKYVDLCNNFVKSMNERMTNIDMHLEKALVEADKCDILVTNIEKLNEKNNTIYSSLIGIGSGFAITEAIIEAKNDKKEKDDKEKKEAEKEV